MLVALTPFTMVLPKGQESQAMFPAKDLYDLEPHALQPIKLFVASPP